MSNLGISRQKKYTSNGHKSLLKPIRNEARR